MSVLDAIAQIDRLLPVNGSPLSIRYAGASALVAFEVNSVP